jgi:hypothetical protein
MFLQDKGILTACDEGVSPAGLACC